MLYLLRNSLTIVAMGTSAPEAAVSISAALKGNADITIGNIVGSNILNILIILGLSAAIAPLAVEQSTIRRDMPFLLGISLLLIVQGWDGSITRFDGLIMMKNIAANDVTNGNIRIPFAGCDNGSEQLRQRGSQSHDGQAELIVQAWDGSITRFDGLIMMILFTAYLIFLLVRARRQPQQDSINAGQRIETTLSKRNAAAKGTGTITAESPTTNRILKTV